MHETPVRFLGWEDPLEKGQVTTLVFLGFPRGSAGKESTCHAGDLGQIPGLGGSPGEGKGYPLLYSGLENSMDCTVHGVTKSWTRLSHFHFTSLQCQVDFAGEVDWASSVLCGKIFFLNYCFSFITSYKTIHVLYPLMNQFQ